MKVADLMVNRFAMVAEDCTISHAAEVLTLTGFNDLIVMNNDDKMVGTLSDGDILRAIMPDLEELYMADLSYSELNKYFMEILEKSQDKGILPLIIRNFITLSPEDSIVKAVTIMLNKGIIRLPVLQNGKCVGVLARSDINWALVAHKKIQKL